MLFNSLTFAIFFPIVAIAYYLAPARRCNDVLLLASLIFYGYWKPENLPLLIISVLITWSTALFMDIFSDQSIRRAALALSLVCNFGILLTFKYVTFVISSLNSLSAWTGLWQLELPPLDFVLPVGISFYIFQEVGYSIDVYRRAIPAERNFARLLLFISFFPQLVAGPIERSSHLLPQFKSRRNFDWSRMVAGMRLILWGLFKKMVVADRLAPLVAAVYNAPSDHSGLEILVATYIFAFQIYCDFSGYSDVAVGAARVLGYDLMENFKQPYQAASLVDFWRRWHISLSTWFRDYLYYPMGGNRVPRWRNACNLLTVFLVSGLWHGANWTFVAWGAMHGLLLTLLVLTAEWRKRLSDSAVVPGFLKRRSQVLSVLLTFHVVAFSWIFFRANSLADALILIQGLSVWKLDPLLLTNLGSRVDLCVAAVAIFTLLLGEGIRSGPAVRLPFQPRPVWQTWIACYVLIFGIVFFGRFGSTEFIYFQF